MYNQGNYKSYGHQGNRDYRDRSREKSNRRDRSGQRQQYDSRRRKRSRSSSNQRHYDNSRRDSRHRRDSRSNSKEQQRRYMQSAQSYPEKQAEQTEQKIRLAIRNNLIQFDAKLLQILRSLPIGKREQLKEQADSTQKINECILVRELFISGLQEMNEHFIQEIMQQYGAIQKIQIVRNFAYVKFHRVEDASNACAEYHIINMKIHSMHNPNFKIFFADHIKRWNVVSNSINYQNQSDLVPVVYASIKNEPPFNTEAHLREVFIKFGHVRNLELKIPTMKPYKTYVLVEYQTLIQAMRAREKLRPNRQRYLGDRKSEVTLLLDSDKVTRQCPNVKNQLRYQIKRLQNTATNNQNQMNQMNKTVNPYIQHMDQSKHMSQVPLVPQNHESANDIFAMIREFTEKEPEMDQEESDWVGFLTRKKQFKVQVDFNLIHKVPFQLESILNVSHRGSLQQGMTRQDYVMAGKFKASNSYNVNAFHDYINYFIKKNRAGIIQSKNYLIYLLPPIQNLPYSIKPDQMLALFFKI